jgi:hypothetical protein
MGDEVSAKSDEVSDEELGQIITEIFNVSKRVVFSKTAVVAAVYVVAFTSAGVGFYKSLVVAIAAAGLLFKDIAPVVVLRGEERFSFWSSSIGRDFCLSRNG